jgi:hippurate hydrolase
VELSGSVRTLKPETRHMVEHRFQRIVGSTAEAHGAIAEIEYRRAHPPTINTPEEAAIASSVVSLIVGDDKVLRTNLRGRRARTLPSCWRTVLAHICSSVSKRATMVGIALHNPAYHFNDNLLPIGVAFFARLTERVLG